LLQLDAFGGVGFGAYLIVSVHELSKKFIASLFSASAMRTIPFRLRDQQNTRPWLPPPQLIPASRPVTSSAATGRLLSKEPPMTPVTPMIPTASEPNTTTSSEPPATAVNSEPPTAPEHPSAASNPNPARFLDFGARHILLVEDGG
jgi:hypothetical protein